MHVDFEILLRFFLAVLWGGIVGAECEYKSKSAGFRTMIMISFGACFFTVMSMYIGSGANPDRIASNIVTGIGFLGAGVIFRGENRINGITTAATIWAVAAVGMGIGAGLYFAAACSSIVILMVLAVLSVFENMIDRFNQSKTYSISCRYSPDAKQHFQALFKEYAVKYKIEKEVKEDGRLQMFWKVQGHFRKHESLIAAIQQDALVERFEY